MTATEIRRLAARVNLLRAHVELAAVCERDGQHREALALVRDLLDVGERRLTAEADVLNRTAV